MRHDAQRLHPCESTRLQATATALRNGTGRIAPACGLQDGHGELRQRPARIDRQREDKTFPAPADHA